MNDAGGMDGVYREDGQWFELARLKGVEKRHARVKFHDGSVQKANTDKDQDHGVGLTLKLEDIDAFMHHDPNENEDDKKREGGGGLAFLHHKKTKDNQLPKGLGAEVATRKDHGLFCGTLKERPAVNWFAFWALIAWATVELAIGIALLWVPGAQGLGVSFISSSLSTYVKDHYKKSMCLLSLSFSMDFSQAYEKHCFSSCYDIVLNGLRDRLFMCISYSPR